MGKSYVNSGSAPVEQQHDTDVFTVAERPKDESQKCPQNYIKPPLTRSFEGTPSTANNE